MHKLFTKGLSFILILSVFFTFSASPALAAVTYLYDANGNMTSDGTDCYHYNEANQMDKVTKCANGQTIAEYVYDYSGMRLVKKEFENGVLKKTIYSPADEFETVKQASNGATANTNYYKANDELVAKKNPDGSITYYHNDHLGSSAVLSDQSGAVVEKTSYEPYGEVKSGGTKSKFGYTGQEQDNETGLNYYNARYYDPHLQRFIQPDTLLPDPYDPQQLNRYSYANNNPLKYTDPTGHFGYLFAAGVGAIVGGLIGAATAFVQTASKPNAKPLDYVKAVAFGAATGAAVGAVSALGGVGTGNLTASLLAKSALSNSTQKTITNLVASVGGGQAGNSTNNIITKQPLLYNSLEVGITSIATFGLPAAIAGKYASTGRGSPTKMDWSTELSPIKEVKELKNLGLSEFASQSIDSLSIDVLNARKEMESINIDVYDDSTNSTSLFINHKIYGKY